LMEVPERFVVDALVAKKLVVVAELPVAFTNVMFWKVEEALARRLVKVPCPVEVRLPVVRMEEKRLVVLAVTVKRLEVVAFTEVELRKLRFPLMVVEPEFDTAKSVVEAELAMMKELEAAVVLAPQMVKPPSVAGVEVPSVRFRVVGE